MLGLVKFDIKKFLKIGPYLPSLPFQALVGALIESHNILLPQATGSMELNTAQSFLKWSFQLDHPILILGISK